MTEHEQRVSMRLMDVRMGLATDVGFRPLTLVTDRGEIEGRLTAGDSSVAMVWLGGADDRDGPARNLYAEMSAELTLAGIGSLQLQFRTPGVFAECLLDALAGVTFLTESGNDAIGIVGHAFAGAVAIEAAAANGQVRLCVGLAPSPLGAASVGRLGPRCALLLAHGTGDRVIPAEASRMIFAAAQEPKQLSIFEFADHSLDLPADEIRRLIREHIARYLAPVAVWPPILGSGGPATA